MKILLPMHGFVTWNGGVDLMRVISAALRSVRIEERIELVYAFPHVWPGQSAGSLQLREMVRAYALDGTIVDCDEDGRGINLAAVDTNADVIFPTMWPIKTRHRPKVAYIYDFQHRELPHLFPDAERARRDHEFAELASRSDAMFATSRHVATCMQKYLGVAADRILVMPYTPYMQDTWFDESSDVVRNRYGIGPRFVLVSNHFWVHKDHGTVIRAFLALAAESRFDDLELVLTGDTTDDRDPGHFERLQALIRESGHGSRIHVLGFIDKAEQLALLRAAAMLVQPTLFEGGPGGGASYEAVGLGTPLLLSDITVNLEVQGERVGYFRAGDAVDLSVQMRRVLSEPMPTVDRAVLQTRSIERLKHSGRTMVEFLREMVRES